MTRMRRARVAAVLLAVLVPAGCGSRPTFSSGRLEIETSTGIVRLHVEIADTDRARRVGLQHRRRLAPGAGMAFVFDRPTTAGFWMKDTLIPLDIAYWSQGGRVVAILHMTPCIGDPCPLYVPGHPYVGAVEANRGFFGQHCVAPGDIVRLTRSS